MSHFDDGSPGKFHRWCNPNYLISHGTDDVILISHGNQTNFTKALGLVDDVTVIILIDLCKPGHDWASIMTSGS